MVILDERIVGNMIYGLIFLILIVALAYCAISDYKIHRDITEVITATFIILSIIFVHFYMVSIIIIK